MKWIVLVFATALSACATPPPTCPILPDGLTPEVIEMCKALGCTIVSDPTMEHIEELLKNRKAP